MKGSREQVSSTDSGSELRNLKRCKSVSSCKYREIPGRRNIYIQCIEAERLETEANKKMEGQMKGQIRAQKAAYDNKRSEG